MNRVLGLTLLGIIGLISLTSSPVVGIALFILTFTLVVCKGGD